MALVAGPGQIAWKALRSHLGRSRLTLASKDEVLEITGYPIGAVSPFGGWRTLPGVGRVRVLVDPGVFAQEEISIGSGVRGATIIMTSKALQRALGEVEMVELIER
jgi:prolyl-tRNA editing enzyme YbaK/EbsC (Cys-tRNA(Pro) deacylase)